MVLVDRLKEVLALIPDDYQLAPVKGFHVLDASFIAFEAIGECMSLNISGLFLKVDLENVDDRSRMIIP